MKNKNVFFRILFSIIMSLFVFSYSIFPVLGADFDTLNENNYTFVAAKEESKADSEKDNDGKSQNSKDEEKNSNKNTSNSWNVAFWVGSAGCLVLAVVLAIRSGNKKYGKD